jgi:hypothetical protein
MHHWVFCDEHEVPVMKDPPGECRRAREEFQARGFQMHRHPAVLVLDDLPELSAPSLERHRLAAFRMHRCLPHRHDEVLSNRPSSPVSVVWESLPVSGPPRRLKDFGSGNLPERSLSHLELHHAPFCCTRGSPGLLRSWVHCRPSLHECVVPVTADGRNDQNLTVDDPR